MNVSDIYDLIAELSLPVVPGDLVVTSPTAQPVDFKFLTIAPEPQAIRAIAAEFGDQEIGAIAFGARYVAGIREVYIIGPWPPLTTIAQSVMSEDFFWDADVMTREDDNHFRVRAMNGEALYRIGVMDPRGRLLHLVACSREPQDFWPEGKA